MSVDPEGLALATIPQGLSSVGQVSYGKDDALGIEFYKRKIFMPEIRKENKDTGEVTVVREAGETEKLYCRITFVPHSKRPGDVDVWDGEATEDHKQQYWRHWQAYQAGETGQYGMALEQLRHPLMDGAQIKSCRKHGVHTVEQLAAQPDHALSRLSQHGFALRKAAQDALQVKAAQTAMREAQSGMQSQVDVQAKQIEELTKQIEQLTAPKGKKDESKVRESAV